MTTPATSGEIAEWKARYDGGREGEIVIQKLIARIESGKGLLSDSDTWQLQRAEAYLGSALRTIERELGEVRAVHANIRNMLDVRGAGPPYPEH